MRTHGKAKNPCPSGFTYAICMTKFTSQPSDTLPRGQGDALIFQCSFVVSFEGSKKEKRLNFQKPPSSTVQVVCRLLTILVYIYHKKIPYGPWRKASKSSVSPSAPLRSSAAPPAAAEQHAVSAWLRSSSVAHGGRLAVRPKGGLEGRVPPPGVEGRGFHLQTQEVQKFDLGTELSK